MSRRTSSSRAPSNTWTAPSHGKTCAHLAKLGVLGMAVPEEYGGLGLPVLDTALVLEEIAKGCYVTAMAVLGEVGVQTRIISTYAPEHIRKRILPAVVTGDCILAICMTEPDAGTDVANYKTNTDITGNTLRLNGVKTLISRADEAGMFVVFTRINKQPGRAGIGCVLVEKGTPGFTVSGKFHTMGGENLHEIRFENCELPLENLVLREDGFVRLLTAFNTQRCLKPEHFARLRGRRIRGSHPLRARPRSLRPADRRFPGHALEARRNVQGNRNRPQHPLSRLRHRQPISRSAISRRSRRSSATRWRYASPARQSRCMAATASPTNIPVSRFYRGARYGTLGGGTSETLRELLGKRIMSGMDENDGILSLGAF